MATPSEKLAGSLTRCERSRTAGSSPSVPPTSRAHRERLVRHGFLQPVIKGWYVAVSPDRGAGDCTA